MADIPLKVGEVWRTPPDMIRLELVGIVASIILLTLFFLYSTSIDSTQADFNQNILGIVLIGGFLVLRYFLLDKDIGGFGKKPNFYNGLTIGVIMSVLVIIGIIFKLTIGFQSVYQFSFDDLVQTFIFSVVLIPFAEEIFGSRLMRLVFRFTNSNLAVIIIVPLLFGVYHIVAHGASDNLISGLIGTVIFRLEIVIANTLLKTDGYGIGRHYANNFFQFLLRLAGVG